MNHRKYTKKGFTLIELLVVIAIIGILASVVLTQVNSARNKTLDVAIKSDLDAVRATATVLYDTLGNKYNAISGGATAVSGDCAAVTALTDAAFATAVSTPTATSPHIFQNTNINLALNHIKKSNSNTALVCYIDGAGAGYAVVAPLKTSGVACVDGTGQLKTTTGNTSTAYTAAVGTDGTPVGSVYALATATDTVCN